MQSVERSLISCARTYVNEVPTVKWFFVDHVDCKQRRPCVVDLHTLLDSVFARIAALLAIRGTHNLVVIRVAQIQGLCRGITQPLP